MTSQSDDEIFFNKISIRNTKEVVKKKKRCSTRFEGVHNDNSFKIIETCSEPDLSTRVALNNSISSAGSDFDKSLLNIENIVADYELRCINKHVENSKSFIEKVKELNISTEVLNNHYKEKDVNKIHNGSGTKCGQDEVEYTDAIGVHSPKLNDKASFLKPCRKEKIKSSYVSAQKNPSKCNLFEHIISPVAMYIKQSPQVPLLQNVKPEKPLTGTHSIPDLQTGLRPKSSVEYKPLPSVAYKCAKNTKVIEIPDESKLPHCRWARKLISTLPGAVVMKHVQRKNVILSKRNESQTDNSFADLTLHQAKLSICTSESAFHVKNKNS